MPNLTITRYAGHGIRIGRIVVFVRDVDVDKDYIELWTTSEDTALIFDGQMIYDGRQEGYTVRQCKLGAPGDHCPDGEVEAASGEAVIIDDTIIVYVRWMEADGNVRFVIDAPVELPIERIENGRVEWFAEKRRSQKGTDTSSG